MLTLFGWRNAGHRGQGADSNGTTERRPTGTPGERVRFHRRRVARRSCSVGPGRKPQHRRGRLAGLAGGAVAGPRHARATSTASISRPGPRCATRWNRCRVACGPQRQRRRDQPLRAGVQAAAVRAACSAAWQPTRSALVTAVWALSTLVDRMAQCTVADLPAHARGRHRAPAAGTARAVHAGGQAVGRRARGADDRHAATAAARSW